MTAWLLVAAQAPAESSFAARLLEISGKLDGFAWGWLMIALCLAAGVFFSLIMGFPQVRLIPDMLKQLLHGEASTSGVSSFQGFAMALGGRVGTGNITGVATAIYFGGPGAVFWMWAIAFLGAGSAYAESALAQVWKIEAANGEYRGGPAYYMEKGLRQPWLGVAFSVLTIVCCGILLPGVQSNAFTAAGAHAFFPNAEAGAFKTPNLIFGLLYTVLCGYIVLGGGKRIAKAAEMIVPFMAGAYILLALIILLVNAGRIPEVFGMIFGSAFGANAVFGAILGQAVQWGVKRGIFSNEAGQGTGAQAAGAAEVSHPAKQGLVQAFSVYVDTLFVCTATALMILSTNAFNTANPAVSNGFLAEHLPGIAKENFTQTAVNSFLPGFGGSFVAIALFLFTLTTVIAYAFYADSNITYLYKDRMESKAREYQTMLIVGRLLVILSTFMGTQMAADTVWNFGSAGVGFMAIFNVIAILLLYKPAVATLRDYEQQKKMGLDPVFVPQRLGIANAEAWDSITQRNYPEHLAKLSAAEQNR